MQIGMFPTKQDTGGLSVPLVSFTGRAPYISKYLNLPEKQKGDPAGGFFHRRDPL